MTLAAHWGETGMSDKEALRNSLVGDIKHIIDLLTENENVDTDNLNSAMELAEEIYTRLGKEFGLKGNPSDIWG